ncbi:GFA family protein [Ruegeria arenilitoris]|uniref:GFA family protein n=1 Tax=Ruegeria arenilitoris TaxID=1173585 RepID=UPI0034644BAC
MTCTSLLDCRAAWPGSFFHRTNLNLPQTIESYCALLNVLVMFLKIKIGVLEMIDGSCCCGAVKFKLKTKPSVMGTCHCSRCRKAGASTIVFVKKEDLNWVAGKDKVATYQPGAPYKYGRCFCTICGSSLGEILSSEDSFPIAANALDSDISLTVQFHEFVSEKPCWYEICDDAPQSTGHPS